MGALCLRHWLLSSSGEAEIDGFKPVPFYTVTLELPGFTVAGELMKDKAAAEQAQSACQSAVATVKQDGAVKTNRKSRLPSHDLTTLQRDANRLLGYTAQQTLDYLQNLYERSLHLSPHGQPLSDFGHGEGLPVLVNLVA